MRRLLLWRSSFFLKNRSRISRTELIALDRPVDGPIPHVNQNQNAHIEISNTAYCDRRQIRQDVMVLMCFTGNMVARHGCVTNHIASIAVVLEDPK